MTATVNTGEWQGIVNRIIASWSGYQLAVDFSSGGPETLEKDKWFKDMIAEHILASRGLKAEDLEDWLNNVLYVEFNLILEDDSVYPISLLLIEAFGYLKHNERTRLDNLINALPSIETVRETIKQSQCGRDDDEEDMEMGDISESEESEAGDQVEEEPKKERQRRMITNEDGWTTIMKK